MEKKTRKPLTQAQRDRKNAAARAKRAAKANKPAVTKPQPKANKPKSKAGRPHGKPPMRKLSEKSGKFVRPVKIKQNGITRPNPTDGNGKPRKTFRVWQIADEISAKTKKPATRAAVLTVCKKERIPYSTFSNSFYQWRKFNGMRLRLRKDGKLSKPMGPGHGPNAKKQGKKAAAKPSRKPPVPAKKKPASRKPAVKSKPAVAPVATTVAPAPVVAAPPVSEPSPAPAAEPSAKPPVPGKPAVPAFMAPPPV